MWGLNSFVMLLLFSIWRWAGKVWIYLRKSQPHLVRKACYIPVKKSPCVTFFIVYLASFSAPQLSPEGPQKNNHAFKNPAQITLTSLDESCNPPFYGRGEAALRPVTLLQAFFFPPSDGLIDSSRKLLTHSINIVPISTPLIYLASLYSLSLLLRSQDRYSFEVVNTTLLVRKGKVLLYFHQGILHLWQVAAVFMLKECV